MAKRTTIHSYRINVCSLVAAFFLILCATNGSFAQSLERDKPPCTEEATSAALQGARNDDAASLYLMGRYLSTGKCTAYFPPPPGQTPNEQGLTAIGFYEQAAAKNYPPAFYNLGIIHAAQQMFADAERYFQKGAELGHRGCELQLGILYSFPDIPVGDNIKAFAWLSLAASRPNADPAARSVLKRVKKQMTTSQRTEGEALLKKLHEKFDARTDWQSDQP